MDDRAIQRALRAAPGPAFRAGHDARLEARLEAGLDAQGGAALHGSARRWRAVAALIALVGAVWLIVAWRGGRPQAVARVTAVPVYWSRDGSAVRLDIRRWTCDGCAMESSKRPTRREGARP